jgi:hypothetical protein
LNRHPPASRAAPRLGRAARRWFAAVAASALCAAQGAASDFSGAHGQQLRQAMQQLSQSQAGESAFREAAALPSGLLQERTRLLETGEAALARLDTAAALGAFERAALILHAADTEMALVRSHMQAGEYRRALAFGAHTAGAHLDVVGGSALYAWLLHAGGQAAVAQRLLAEAQARAPDQPVVQAVQRQLQTGAPMATAPLLRQPPVRLAPYGDATGLPGRARLRGSGFLLGSGRHALVPLTALPASGRLWLRNGLGQLARATLQRRDVRRGVALLVLSRPLPVPAQRGWAEADAFPGSVAHAVEYSGGGPLAQAPATPAWPQLHSGFIGGVARDGTAAAPQRLLGVALPPGPRGGPVFNAAGQFSGLALNGKAPGGDRFLPLSTLREALGAKHAHLLGTAQPTGGRPAAAAMDEIYEASLKLCLQVLVAR